MAQSVYVASLASVIFVMASWNNIHEVHHNIGGTTAVDMRGRRISLYEGLEHCSRCRVRSAPTGRGSV